MGNTITTISYSTEVEQYIRENGLKPSKIVQDFVKTAIESEKVSVKAMQDVNRRILALQETINKQRNYIESKGLMDEFLGIR
jgi:hypothetical protein